MYMKIKTREDKVAEFHRAMGLDLGSEPRVSLLALRASLIQEETSEVCQVMRDMERLLEYGKSIDDETWEHFMKELADLQYVLSGTIVSFDRTYGTDFDVAFNRVHTSNMSKLDDEGKPVKNEMGKVTKGPNYQPASMKGIV